MPPEFAAQLETLIAETRRSTDVLSERLNAMTASIQGRINQTVFAGTVVVPSSGVWSSEWATPYGSVQIIGPAGPATITNSGPETSAPTSGPGVAVILDMSKLVVPIPLIGRQLSIYAPAGTVLYVCVRS